MWQYADLGFMCLFCHILAAVERMLCSSKIHRLKASAQ